MRLLLKSELSELKRISEKRADSKGGRYSMVQLYITNTYKHMDVANIWVVEER